MTVPTAEKDHIKYSSQNDLGKITFCVHVAECRGSLKSLQTFTMIRNDLTSSESYTNPCHCTRHSLFQILSSKKTNLHKPFQAVTFYHDARSSHVLSINLLELLVQILSITSYYYS